MTIMILNFKANKQETNASASVVDGKLVLSLPDAIAPIVWQMDLAHAKASALEVLRNEETGQHILNLKTPKGEKVEIAAFSENKHAIEGLMAASRALTNAHGQIHAHNIAASEAGPSGPTSPAMASGSKYTATGSKATGKKWMGTILALAVLFILFTIWSSVIPRPVTTGGGMSPASTAETSSQSSSGVPVSADDFLKRR